MCMSTKMSVKILKGPELKSELEEKSLGHFFFNYGLKNGDKICQIDPSSGNKESFSNVRQRSITAAINLQEKQITSKDVIAFYADNTLDSIIPVLAAFYLGAKVACFDPTFSKQWTKKLLLQISPNIIFIDEKYVNLIETILKEIKLEIKIFVYGTSSEYETFNNLMEQDERCKNFTPVDVDVNDTVLIVFSSGTSGLPKPVCHSHKSFLYIINVLKQKDFPPLSTTLHFVSNFDLASILILTKLFVEGSAKVTAPDLQLPMIFKIIEDYQIQTLYLLPIETSKLLKLENTENYNTNSVKMALITCSPMSSKHLQKLSQLFHNFIINFSYGMTEIASISSFAQKADGQFSETGTGYCGKLSTGVILKIVDSSNEKRLLEPRVKGEILVKSQALMKSYYNPISEEIFDADGFLKTGDFGYYDEDGCLYVIGRIKDNFKYKSSVITPTVIENVLLEHPAVDEAVVYGVPTEEGDAPAAFIVKSRNCKNEEEVKSEIDSFVSRHVKEHESLQRRIQFVDSLPKTATGKYLRQEIRRLIPHT